MPRQVLIIHGWSDHSDSLHALAAFLAAHGYDARMLWLADYISMRDDVRVQDVAVRMAEVIDAKIAAGELQTGFDMIVHSTGGLVARAWLTTRYRGAAPQCPVRRLVMLAPANHGSKLAAMGKSMLGKLVKGYRDGFRTGKAMLEDLELSSPFQWELAQRDLLIAPGGDKESYYGEDRVWPFVIVGTRGYTGLFRQLANENGSDGTVRVCAAHLAARGMTIDFRQERVEDMIHPWPSRMAFETPLAVLPTRTHGSIIDPDRANPDSREDFIEDAAEREQLGALIVQALACHDFDAYLAIQQRWYELSEATARRADADPQSPTAAEYHQYLQINTYVVDDHGKPVPDYFLELTSREGGGDDDANVYLHANVIEDVKKNTQNPALRNLYLDHSDLTQGYYQRFAAGVSPVLYLSIYAEPPGENVNYFDPANPQARGRVPVHLRDEATQRWLRRNSTHFIQMLIPRRPVEGVFRLKRYG